MTQGTLSRFRRRSRELEQDIRRAEQRGRLRNGLGFTGGDDSTWVTLHVDVALGGGGPRWSFMAGDVTNVLFGFRATKPEGDAPGYYGRVLNVVRQTEPAAIAPNLDLEALKDPTSGMSFATGLHVSTGNAAGSYGIYNLSAVTGSDAHLRDGHPADTVDNLPWQRLREQALEAGAVMRAVADRAELSLPRVFARLARSRYPRFQGGRADGNYAGLQVSGSLSEDRPAAGALMAIWPGEQDWKRKAWDPLGDAFWVPSIEPINLEADEENRSFPIVGLRTDL
jgi:hypothetical protein